MRIMRVTTRSCLSSGLATLRSCKWPVPGPSWLKASSSQGPFVEPNSVLWPNGTPLSNKTLPGILELKDACAKCAAALLQMQFLLVCQSSHPEPALQCWL